MKKEKSYMTTITFATIVQEIQKLTTEEKEHLQHLVTQFLIEEKRKTFYKSYQDSINEEEQGKLIFSSDIEELKKMLEDE